MIFTETNGFGGRMMIHGDALGIHLDSNCGIISGWAFDPVNSKQSIEVELRLIDPSNDAIVESRLRFADKVRNDVNNAFGIIGQYG